MRTTVVDDINGLTSLLSAPRVIIEIVIHKLGFVKRFVKMLRDKSFLRFICHWLSSPIDTRFADGRFHSMTTDILFQMVTTEIGRVTLNQETKRNALSAQMWLDFKNVIEVAAAEH